MNIYLQPLWRGTLAQLVEQRTENPCVPGSIPGGTTKKSRNLGLRDFLFLMPFLRHYQTRYGRDKFNLNQRQITHSCFINIKRFTLQLKTV